MWLESLRLININSYPDSSRISFSRAINVITGDNNAGKSIILKSIYSMQVGGGSIGQWKRIGTSNSKIEFYLEDIEDKLQFDLNPAPNFLATVNNREFHLESTFKNGYRDMHIVADVIPTHGIKRFDNHQPNNFIHTFFSERKISALSNNINREHSTTIFSDLRNLTALVDDTLNNSQRERYFEICNDILGFEIRSSAQEGEGSGKDIGLLMDDYGKMIYVSSMGAGTLNILGIVLKIIYAKKQLFLIEELENDVHPKALKKILHLILDSAKTRGNQFIVSTHSNIVLNYLAGIEGSKVFNVSMKLEDKIPTSSIKELTRPEERLKALYDLGYEMVDFNLYEGYLILEESSAEFIIREILIPWYVPALINKLRTIASQGVDDMEPRFANFERLFTFIYLSKDNIYKNKVWVYADNDSAGQKVIRDLKSKYTSVSKWNTETFENFIETDFEKYYPAEFKEKVKSVLSITDKEEKRKQKKILLEEVIKWSISNEKESKVKFKESFKDIISILEKISEKINS